MQNNWLLGLLAAVLLLNITVTVLLLTKLQPTSLEVPVRYTSLTNFDELGSWQTLYLLPGLMWVFSIVNTWLAARVYLRSRVTSFMLMIGSLGYGLLTLQIAWLYIGVTSGAH